VITAEARRNLSEMSFDFQGLDVAGVSVDGVPARFEQVDAEPRLSENPQVTQPMKLVVTPARAARPRAGRRFSVEVAYSGAPQHITDADTSIEGWIRACFPLEPPPRQCDGSFVVNEPIGAQSWFPANNHPSDKATFDTVITVPEGKVAFGVGELVARGPNAGGRVTWHWRERAPTATYLTTGTVGDFDYDEGAITERSTGRTLAVYNGIDSSATDAQRAAVQGSLDRVPEQLNFVADLLGAYPLGSIGAVADRAAGVGYALEVQGHYPGDFETGEPGIDVDTQLHEIAHQWFGNTVSPSTWQEIWFNEGWAEWFTWHWVHAEDGAPGSPADLFAELYDDPDFDWEIPPGSLGGPENMFALDPVYQRPAMKIEGYRQILGDDERFFGFARHLLDRFANGNISRREFVAAALQWSGFGGQRLELLEAYFRQWLSLRGRPTILPADFRTP
jgi:hypothetical protein